MFRLLFVLSLLSWVNLHAQELFFRQVYEKNSASTIEVTGLFSKLPISGFAPVRVKIANRLNVPVKFTLSFRSISRTSYRNDDLLMKSSFALSCPAAQVSSQDLLVPVAALVKNSGYSYSQPLTLQANLFGMSQGSYTQSSYATADFPQLLMSEALFTPNASTLDGALNKSASGSRSYGSEQSFAGKFDPKQMPEDWRAYVGYDGLMLTSKDWQEMSPGARSAILRWNRQGGWLQFFSSRDGETWESLGIDVDAPHQSLRGLGPIRLDRLGADLKLEPSIWLPSVNKSANAPSRRAQLLQKDYSTGTWELPQWLGKKTFYFAVFIILLVIFGILVGPINLFVFAKSGQRHKLFITTPLISLGASLLMIILIFAQDGIGGTGVRVQWVHLVHEKGDHHAYVHQEQFTRTGVLMGARFTLDEPCVITPLPLSRSQWTRLTANEGPTQSFELQEQDGTWNAAGDWFQSRSEQAQLLQAIRPSRARIERADPADATKLMSNLDHSLRHFFLRDGEGRFWQAHDVAPGKTFQLQPCSAEVWQKFLDTEISAISEAQQMRIKKISERAEHFISISEDAPMIETTSSTDWSRSKTILTGKISSDPAL